MNEFQIAERARAFARTMEHLRAALGHIRAAQAENVSFSLNLGELAQIDRSLMHEIHCCAHVYKQPPETPA
jgi:hypothetical protein